MQKKGSLEIDGQEINRKNVKSYQNKFGYIPQNFYLFDNSIRQNITISDYKESASSSNEDRVIFEILEKLKLKIVSEDGLGTQVGENAIRLSGGRDKGLVLQEYYFTTKIYLFLMRQQTPWIKTLKKKFLTSFILLRAQKQ